MKIDQDAILKVEIDAIWTDSCGSRIVQVFPYGDVNDEHCIHGIKLRWSCDKCEEALNGK